MSLIIRVLDAAYCSSTHHKLALDALDHLRAARAPAWRDFLVTYHQMYFEGAKDPDKTFKDFTNHVLHVRDNYWGGAREQVRHWYGATVRALWRKEWSLAAYSAGVLSHYVTDPLMPFHTGQTKEETNIHRAVEWSIRQSYDDLRELARSRMGYPHLEAGTHPGWLDELVTAGAEISNGYYEALIEHFDFAKSIKEPKEGLDQAGREMISQLIGFATISLARILDRAFVEAGVAPPATQPTLEGIFSLLDIPIAWVTKNISDARERALVENQYREWVATGQVERTLTADVRQVREEAAKAKARVAKALPAALEVQPSPQPAPAPQQVAAEPPVPAPTPTAPQAKLGLQLSDDVERAPSIGPKTAERLNACGVRTIGDLLESQAGPLSQQLGGGWNSPSVVLDWQDQARLILEVPALRAEQAKLLTGAGYRTAATLAQAQPEELLQDVNDFLQSPRGQRALRGDYTPTLRDMETWIGWAEAAAPPDTRRETQPGKVELPS
jgi:predicted flap endonuclease-1-like 5' DNA nuclease